MTWVKLDDRFAGNPKIRRAWRRSNASVGLYCMSLAYAAQHETDGVVDLWWVEEVMPNKRERAAATNALLDAGLWVEHDDEHVFIHDYLDYNESAEELAARRERDRTRKSRGGKRPKPKPSNGSPQGFQEDSARNPDGVQVASGSTRGRGPSRPGLTTPPPPVPGGAVGEVFKAWQESTGKTRTVLDTKRRRRIATALKTHPLEDLVDAVKGWRHSPHHRGENPTATIYNDLDLLLRDAAHIEKFRDLERQASGATVHQHPAAAVVMDTLPAHEQVERINAARDRMRTSTPSPEPAA